VARKVPAAVLPTCPWLPLMIHRALVDSVAWKERVQPGEQRRRCRERPELRCDIVCRRRASRRDPGSTVVSRCVSDGATNVAHMITVEDVRRITASLPRSYEVVVRDQIKFRVGQIVFVAFSRDETVMGVGFPKEERAAMVAAEPDKFMLPSKSDMRYNWIHVRLDAIDLQELRELVIDGWRMCVPKSVAASIN
jgi:hypothetical protein